MTYEELLDKWLRKLGRDCTAGEIVHDLRQLEQPRNLYYEQLQKESDGELVAVVRCKDCKHNSLNRRSGNAYCEFGFGLYQLDDFCSRGERREDEAD